jgi:hypothetical protein
MRREKWRVLSQPSKAEKRARRIEIECVEAPGTQQDGYIVCVTPKGKNEEPGKESKGFAYMNPIKRVFSSEESVIEYLKEVL